MWSLRQFSGKKLSEKKNCQRTQLGTSYVFMKVYAFEGFYFYISICFRFCMRTFGIIQYNQIRPASILKLDTPNAKQQKARSQMKEKDAKREYAIKRCICAKRDQKRLFLQTH